MKKTLALALCLLMAVSLLSGCAGGNSNVIKIGINYELSGGVATYGVSSVQGIELAIKEINAAGGINGKQIELVKYDNKSETAEAVTLAAKLMTSDKVVAVMGPATSGNFKATIPSANEYNVPVISGSATADDVTVTDDGVQEYAFRICFNDSYQGVTMANFALNSKKAKTAAILMDTSSDYAIGLADNFKSTFEAGGGTIVATESYTDGDTDFSSVITKLASKNFDVIFIPGYYEEVGLIIKELRAKNIKVPVLGADGFDSPVLLELAGAAALSDVYFSNHYSSLGNDPLVKDFIAAFKAEYGKEPDAFNALGYDLAKFVVDAISRAGNKITGKTVKKALESTENLAGVTGTITVDDNHNAAKSIVVIELQNGIQVNAVKS